MWRGNGVNVAKVSKRGGGGGRGGLEARRSTSFFV
jgi:hypothetical protein